MQFRHLDYASSATVEQLGAAAIDDVLDRGDLEAWKPIARAIRADPFGPLADTVFRLCAAHPMYGTSALWRTWITRLRREPSLRDAATLADLRARAGVTQQQVAQRMGISQSDVSKLEHRKDVKLSTLRAYAEAIGGTLNVAVGLRKPKAQFNLSLGDPPVQGAPRQS